MHHLLEHINPTLVDNVSITPGLSDHDIVLAKVDAKPEITKQVIASQVHINSLNPSLELQT